MAKFVMVEPGCKEGETRHEGMARRKKEGDRKSRALWKQIQAAEAEKKAEALRLIEERLGGYDDRPL